MLSETFKKVGFLSLGLSLAMTSCSDDAEQTKLPEAQPTSNLEVSSEIIQQVEDLWKIIGEHEEIWQGKKPMGVAAALIYLAGKTSGHVRTQAEVCAVAKVSEVTLRGLIRIFDTLMKRLGESNMN